MNLLLLTAAALSGWMCSLYLILILMTRKNHDVIQRDCDSIQKIAEETNKQLEQNMKHIEAVTGCVEEMNKNWEEQVRGYIERSEQ